MTSWWLPSFVFFLHNLISFQYKSVGSSNPYTYSPSYAPQADVGPLNKEKKKKNRSDTVGDAVLSQYSVNETAQAFHLEKCNVVSSHSGFVSANSGQLLPMTFLYPNYNTLVYRGSFPKSRESFWSEKRRKTSRRWRVKPGLRFFALEPLEWNQKRNPGAWEEPIKWFYSQVCSNLLP